MKRMLWMYFVDVLLLMNSMLAVLLLKGNLPTYTTTLYKHFYIGYALCWTLFYFLSDKHKVFFEPISLWHKLWANIKTGMYVGGLMLIIFIGFKVQNISRSMFFGSLLLTLAAETVVILLLHLTFKQIVPVQKEQQRGYKLGLLEHIKFTSLDFFSIDVLLLWFSFLVMAWLKPATVRLALPNHWKPFLIVTIIWVVLSLVNQKYDLRHKRRFSEVISGIVYADLFVLGAVAFLVFVLKQFQLSRQIIFGSMGIAFLLEAVISMMLFYARQFAQANPSFARTSILSHSRLLEEDLNGDATEEKEPYQPEYYEPGFCCEGDGTPIRPTLQRITLHHNADGVYRFIDEHLNIDQVRQEKAFLGNTATLFNLESIPDGKLDMLLNLHKINDFRRINLYLIEANRTLRQGGVFVGCGQTLAERQRGIIKRLTPLLGYPVHAFDFLFNRIFPKLKLTQGLYFALTKGRNRPLSKCEILGRLHFCGFRIVHEAEVEGLLYFIAVKTAPPSEDPNPSYGPLFRMKRSGKGGKQIYVYKFRTMHPYAEYMQHFMVERYGYGDKGKIDDDFRVTKWGRWMRKLWLDELPQLINWVQGDLALVGVRPLSKRFLAEYPPELIEERFRYKPGCIPPYVALKMQAVEEYIESERIYLADKRKHPFLTDVRYMVWAVYNIVTNRIRSE